MADKHEFRDILRIGDKDIEGHTPISHAISLVRGSSFMFANAICKVLKIDKEQKAGAVPSKELEKIEECLRNPSKYNIPSWLVNRQRDIEIGDDRHVISSDLDLTQKFDIRRLKKIRTFRGFRHSRGDKGLKVKARGQRTRSTGRKGKTVGVVRKKK